MPPVWDPRGTGLIQCPTNPLRRVPETNSLGKFAGKLRVAVFPKAIEKDRLHDTFRPVFDLKSATARHQIPPVNKGPFFGLAARAEGRHGLVVDCEPQVRGHLIHAGYALFRHNNQVLCHLANLADYA